MRADLEQEDSMPEYMEKKGFVKDMLAGDDADSDEEVYRAAKEAEEAEEEY